MAQVKEHRAPVRYSLRPHQVREIIRAGRTGDGLTLMEIRGLARRYGSASKVVHQVCMQYDIPIISDRRTARPTPKGMFRDGFVPRVVETGQDEDKEESRAAPEPGAASEEACSGPRSGTSPAPDEKHDTLTRLKKEVKAARSEMRRTRSEFGKMAGEHTGLKARLVSTQQDLRERDREIEHLRSELSEIRRLQQNGVDDLVEAIQCLSLDDLVTIGAEVVLERQRRREGGRARRRQRRAPD